MIEIAKNAASDCQVIWEFAKIIAEHCTDQKYVVKNFFISRKNYINIQCISSFGAKIDNFLNIPLS
jgi:hypothetical protein